MIILNAEDVQKALPMAQTISAMKSAYAATSDGRAETPLRARLDIAPYDGICLFMPSYIQDEDQAAIALKAVSVYPLNIRQNLPVIHAAVLVIEVETGKPIALLEGSRLTAIRTGAASGAATDLLANPDAKTTAIFGAGVQGKTQLEAVCTVREIKTVWIYDPAPGHAQAFAEELSVHDLIPTDLRITDSPYKAANEADIICTATTSKEPVYPGEAIKPGTHINGIGSYTLDMVENPPEVILKAGIFVDSIESVLAEAGDFGALVKNKEIDPHNFTEIGQIVLGNAVGRKSKDQITFFKSVGIAAQDALAAQLALRNARVMGLGQPVQWE